MSIAPSIREALIHLARDAMAAAVQDRPAPPTTGAAALRVPCGGVFVTCRNGGMLRGCLGSFEATKPLEELVRDMAGATMRDPRFIDHPITPDELDQLDVEISILSPPVRTENPLSLRPGIDGVLVRRGATTGCFLPQVAADQGWDAQQTLENCCAMKAGLSADAWRDAGTHVFLFTCEKIVDARNGSARRRPSRIKP